jgi:hypothetical protein
MIPLSREWLSRAMVRSQVARTLAGCGKKGAAAQILGRPRDFVTQEELGAHRLMALRFFFGPRTRFDLDPTVLASPYCACGPGYRRLQRR